MASDRKLFFHSYFSVPALKKKERRRRKLFFKVAQVRNTFSLFLFSRSIVPCEGQKNGVKSV